VLVRQTGMCLAFCTNCNEWHVVRINVNDDTGATR